MSHHQFTHQPLLGTFVTVSIGGVGIDEARVVDQKVVDEIDRLEAILSRFRPDSALERWKRDELADVPVELSTMLARTVEWSEATQGMLNPRAGALTELWRASALDGQRPARHDIDDELRRMREPGFAIDAAGTPRRVGDCAGLDLHACAKGWIVDRAIDAAGEMAPEIVVNAGGDVARRGPGHTVVSIDDPFRPYDNAAPIDRVLLASGGLATSGNARRGISIEGRTYSHIIDPRTGEPADEATSVSVIAASAEAADAWATALMLAPFDTIVEAADDADVAILAVGSDRRVVTNEQWRRHRVGS